jgi:hypothetical protein
MAEMTFDLTFGNQTYKKLRFEEMAKLIEEYTKAEHRAFEMLTKKIDEESPLAYSAAFWSRTLGRAVPPDYAEWIQPLTTLDSARSAWRAGAGSIAIKHLQTAVSQYNAVHKKWIQYRNDLEFGGKMALFVMELTITAATTVFTPGAGASAIRGAGAAAAWTGFTDLATQAGLKKMEVEQKIDLTQVGTKMIAAFAGALCAGALSKKLIDVFMKRLNPGKLQDILYPGMKLPPNPKTELYKLGLLDPNTLQKVITQYVSGLPIAVARDAVTNAVLKSRGKKPSLDDFLGLVVNELTVQNAFKELVGAALGVRGAASAVR